MSDHNLNPETLNPDPPYPPTQADRTVSDLVKAVVKVVLLYSDQLQRQPAFGALWRTILSTLSAVMTVGEGLAGWLCMRGVMTVGEGLASWLCMRGVILCA